MSTGGSKVVVTFGEIMARLEAPRHQRLRQASDLHVTYAGAEANVAVSVAQLGGSSRFVTALPPNPLGDAALDAVRRFGVETGCVTRPADMRLGTYFIEHGANQRASVVVYDRADSAIAATPADAYDWDAALGGADWLHVTGITPALSKTAADAALHACRTATERGLTVSTDLNFRKKLWRWDASTPPRELAEATMRELLPHVSVVVANEEDCAQVLGIRATGTDVTAGHLTTDAYPDVARQVCTQFPNVRQVAIILRESISATHNRWGALLSDREADKVHFAPTDADGNYRPYEITSIVDRVGGGDSFAAGLIFALTTPELAEASTAIRFATAASCLAHSVPGDFNLTTRGEVETLMAGDASGRVQR